MCEILTLVFLLFCSRSQTLPRKCAGDKIHQNITKRFHVISPTLFNTEVCVDASISGCSGKVFVFSVRYVLVGACVPIFFGQAEIDDVYQVTFFPQAPVI